MCGLNAIFAYGAAAAPVARAELLGVRDAMVRRGPDAAGAWISEDGRIGLGHRRLSIIDLSPQANQPMALAGQGLSIVYNGEIYNFRELRRALKAEGRTFATRSDTEVLLQLYAREGAAMVRRLRGMFAFALYDEAKAGLLLARDPFGIKPLYYADDGSTLRCASQVKALLSGQGVGRAPDAAGHVGFFLFGSVPEPHTLHADIRALPAGATLWVDAHGHRSLERYFDPARELAASATPPQVGLGRALADSVAHHMVADVPVGAFLSAGLDSATIVGHAALTPGASLATLTLGFEEYRGSGRDEVPLAEDVARLYGTRHATRWLRRDDFRQQRDEVLAAMDQPSVDGVNTYFVSREAAACGLKVALSGLGGDELFAGYDTFRQIPRLVGALGRIPGLGLLGRGVRAVAAPLLARLGARVSPKAAGVLELGTAYGDAYLLRRGLFMPWELTGVLDADLVRAGWRKLAPRIALAETVEEIAAPGAKVAALELSWYMRNQLLRDADWAGMAHSLEIRLPFVDVPLFRALGSRIGRPGAPDKRAMAATLDPPLPDAVLRRPKSGFFVPLDEWAGEGRERGLRGWARHVYRAAWAEAC